MFRMLSKASLLSLILLSCASSAHATILKYTFTADFVSSDLDDSFLSQVDLVASASSMSGSIVFSLQPGLFPNSLGNTFYAAPTVVFDGIDNSAFDSAPNGVLVANDVNAPPRDGISTLFSPQGTPGVQNAFAIALLDTSGTALSETLLPDLIVFEDYDFTILSFSSTLYDTDGSTVLGGESIEFELTSFDPVLVSAPPLLLLMSIAAIAFIRIRAR